MRGWSSDAGPTVCLIHETLQPPGAVHVKGYLRHVAACNPPVDEVFLPWWVDDQAVGWVRASAVCRAPDAVPGGVSGHRGRLVASAGLSCGIRRRSSALETVARRLAEAGLIPPFMGEPLCGHAVGS